MPNIKPIEKQKKEIEEILFHVLNTMVAKTTQGVSSNLFAFCRNFFDFVPRTSNAYRNLQTFHALDFPKLLQSWTKAWRQIQKIRQNRFFYAMFYSRFFAIFYQKM